MTYSLDDVQEDLLTHIRSSMAQPVHEVSIADTKTVVKNAAGKIQPYIALQFGDLQDGHTQAVAGVQGNDYYMHIYLQAVAADAVTARKMANKLVREVLGFSTRWTGQVRKKPGGSMFPIASSNGATEAYQFPVSFAVTVQLNES